MTDTSRERRFWSKVEMGPGCWRWKGRGKGDGYGVVELSGRRVLAHRMAWILVYGENPSAQVLHHCDNPSCVRPSHLWLGGARDNMHDMMRKRRHQAILSEEQAQEIRSRCGNERQEDLAKEFGVSRSAISMIACGLRYGWAKS